MATIFEGTFYPLFERTTSIRQMQAFAEMVALKFPQAPSKIFIILMWLKGQTFGRLVLYWQLWIFLTFLRNLWATVIFADHLVAITPEGEALELLNDENPVATAKFEAEFGPGRCPRKEPLMATGGSICPFLASVTFGGPDLKTVYLGRLRATTLPYFQSLVAGFPMSHWQ